MLTLQTPTWQQLQETYNWLKGQCFEGVEGVYVHKGLSGGSVFGLTVHTHGNEPCGLAAVWAWRQYLDQGGSFNGTLIITLNNANAADLFWKGGYKDPLLNRYIDHNMNRIPRDAAMPDDVYEFERFKQLKPIWQQFDVAVDFHTTSQEAPPMVIGCHALDENVVRKLPVHHYVRGVSDAVRSKFVTEFYGKTTDHMYMLESGQHQSERAFRNAIECFEVLLVEYGHIEGEVKAHSADSVLVYDVEETCFFEDASYEQVQVFENFAPMKKGEVLATGNGAPIVAPFDGHILMAPSAKKPVYTDEEIFFFSRPMRTLERVHRASKNDAKSA